MSTSGTNGGGDLDLGDFAGLDATAEPKTTAPPAWERRAGEGAKPYAAFRRFIELGDQRSVTAVARKCHVSRSLIGRWSSLHAWQERAREFDEDTAKRTLQTIQARRVRLGLQQVEIAEKMFALVRKSLPRQRKLDTQDTARLFVAAVRALEQAFGDEPLMKPARPIVNIMISRNQERNFAEEEQQLRDRAAGIH